jgi:hypothetical protein
MEELELKDDDRAELADLLGKLAAAADELGAAARSARDEGPVAFDGLRRAEFHTSGAWSPIESQIGYKKPEEFLPEDEYAELQAENAARSAAHDAHMAKLQENLLAGDAAVLAEDLDIDETITLLLVDAGFDRPFRLSQPEDEKRVAAIEGFDPETAAEICARAREFMESA